MSEIRARASVYVGLALLALMGLYAWRNFRVGNDITHFLPSGEDARLAYISRAVAESDLSRTMVLVVNGRDPQPTLAAARALADALRTHPEVAWLRSGVDPALERAVYDVYFPRRHAMLSEHPEQELAPRLTDDGLGAEAQAVRAALASPTGALVARTAGNDPFMGFAAMLQRLRAAQGSSLTLRDGQLATEDGLHAVIFLATRHSAFDAPRQRPFVQFVRARFDAVARANGGGLTLQQSGAHRISVAAEAQVRGDTERISLYGALGVVVLFLLIHRSARYLVLASLPLGAGLVVAMAGSLAVFGRLHGLTLAFGASLIGVCFDYPVYLINHHTLRPDPAGPEATLRRVWTGIVLGALTTMGGLAGLAWTSFPGLREIAVFSTMGVGGALLSTRYLVAPLLPREPIPVRFQRRLADAVARAVEALRGRTLAAVAVPLVALGLCGLGLPRVHWVDDARALTEIDPALFREERAVRALVSRMDDARFVVATGATDEEALQRNDRVAERLATLQRGGVLAGFRSAHALVWSRDLQRRNEATLRASPDLARRASAAFERNGFREGALDGFAEALRSPAPDALTYDALMATPVADLARPFRLRVGTRVGYLTFLSEVHDAGALRAGLADMTEVDLFDQGAFLRETYGRYRRRTLELIGVGLLAVFAMVLARYRRVGAALAACLPSVIGGAVALGVVGLSGTPANLMHLLGLLLVLSVGADYGIFVAETGRHPEAARETLLSVTVAWVSALLSFGLLALSHNPSLRAIGTTTAVGVTFSLLLAPVARHLLVPREVSS